MLNIESEYIVKSSPKGFIVSIRGEIPPDLILADIEKSKSLFGTQAPLLLGALTTSWAEAALLMAHGGSISKDGSRISINGHRTQNHLPEDYTKINFQPHTDSGLSYESHENGPHFFLTAAAEELSFLKEKEALKERVIHAYRTYKVGYPRLSAVSATNQFLIHTAKKNQNNIR